MDREGFVFSYDSRPNDPGHVVLRRLNRIEYENTVEDIFGIDIDAKEFFPADDTGYGFDTIGEVPLIPTLDGKVSEYGRDCNG